MKPSHPNRLFALLGLFLGALLPAFAAGTDSRISAVTVYADRAVVTRTATLDIAATGQQELVFNNLPATLVEQSLQVSGRGTAQVTILDVAARTAYLDFTPNDRVKALEDELRGLEKQTRGLDDAGKLLDQQEQSLVRIEGALTAPPAKETPRASLDELAKLLAFLTSQRAQVSSDRAALDTQREALQAKIEAVQQQLNELRGAGGRSVKTVTVRLAAASTGQLDLALSYALPGAAWSPAYDARLRTDERAVELTYFGVVRNNTGEDWKAVALTLSTARPSMGGGAPELAPWIVDVMQARPMAAMRRDKMMMADEAAAPMQEFAGNFVAKAAAPAPRPIVEAATISAAVESTATSATFKIPVAVTLASDNSTQKVGITTFKLAANLQYQATPKVREAAFLSAYTTNTSDYPLLAGAMNTFLDGTFVATSQLKTVMSGEKFELALGADEGVAIKRKLVNRFTEDTGLTSSGRRTTYEVLVTVTNNKKTAERVVFKEGVPLSRDEKIVVKILTPAERDTGTKAAPKEVTMEEDGKLVWRLDLKPGEKREIPLKYSIEHPANLAVTGIE
ncbi:MAG TPA: mucoidy inhibitor MuiA family protein [Opitutaceae bacterium]|mgnify:FL=1|nr:mucoidy inhibitor MuiA family protein [Opitutaceae bacterium]HOD45994.1 mucoidy inhibitor MuiA family protein [Opitutaceae bacterium]HQL20187.1 mucoidy inhibitor MuiA family protein [Opitutaceae bacterium]